MGTNRRTACVGNKPKSYKCLSSQPHILTRKKINAFERRQAEPPRQPTDAERELVRMFHSTVKRSVTDG